MPNGRVAIVIPKPKTDLEKEIYEIVYKAYVESFVSTDGSAPMLIKDFIELNPWSDEQYKAHVMAKSIPPDATNVREIDDEHIPASREFRNAWIDPNKNGALAISAILAKESKLNNLKLDALSLRKELQDKQMLGEDATEIQSKIDNLLAKSRALKAVAPSDHIDEDALSQIKAIVNNETIKE